MKAIVVNEYGGPEVFKFSGYSLRKVPQADPDRRRAQAHHDGIIALELEGSVETSRVDLCLGLSFH